MKNMIMMLNIHKRRHAPGSFHFLLPGFFLLFVFTSTAQTLRGRVRDADNGAALAGATLSLTPKFQGPSAQNAVSAENGDFQLENLAPGYYACRVRLTGYKPVTIEEIRISAGKEEVLDIALQRGNDTLPNVTVRAPRPGRQSLQGISEIALTRDQTLRFPAMSFDPGRLAAAYPGVVQSDDGINGMSIRGNSPAAVRWRLEGVEVVNPNHLPNAGTFSDGPAAASGGVLMFSAQLLDNSRLLTGSFSPEYGDASGGIMDMYLRPGNAARHEFTAQAGLIGLDLAAEGPLSRKSGSSYLLNYRYSTVGLLSKMGVSFGAEAINFQDLSFHSRFPTRKAGTFSLFGMGGISTNDYAHNPDTASFESYKEFLDIAFKSRSGLLGVGHLLNWGAGTWLKTTLILSGQRNQRDAVSAYPWVNADAHSNNNETSLAAGLTFSHLFNPQNRLQAGVQYSYRYYDGMSTVGENLYYLGQGHMAFLQPWASWNWYSKDGQTTVTGGIHSIYSVFNRRYAVDPRISLMRRIGPKHDFRLSWGMYSATLPSWLYAGRDSVFFSHGVYIYEHNNRDLDFTRSQQAAFRYTLHPVENMSIHAEIFWQEQTRLPVLNDVSNAYSLLNEMEYAFSNQELKSEGKGRNLGAELAAERRLQNGFYWLANVSLVQSSYTGSDGVWRDTRWDIGHAANLLAGKEWRKQKKSGLIRFFGVNGRAVWSGGFRDQAVTAQKNPFYPSAVIDPAPYSEQLPDYFRFDFRVYWKRNLANRRNSTFALELQNATAQQNVAYYYYDPYTGKTETKYQLGPIPYLSWRLEF